MYPVDRVPTLTFSGYCYRYNLCSLLMSICWAAHWLLSSCAFDIHLLSYVGAISICSVLWEPSRLPFEFFKRWACFVFMDLECSDSEWLTDVIHSRLLGPNGVGYFLWYTVILFMVIVYWTLRWRPIPDVCMLCFCWVLSTCCLLLR